MYQIKTTEQKITTTYAGLYRYYCTQDVLCLMTFNFSFWVRLKRVRRGFISNDMSCAVFNECVLKSVCLTKVFHWGGRYDFGQGLRESEGGDAKGIYIEHKVRTTAK